MKISPLLLAAAFALSSAATAADLVVNGSFESPDVPAAVGHVDRAQGASLTVPAGGAAFSGWQVVSASVSVARTPFNDGYETVLAGDGSQFVDLTAATFNGQGALEQTVATVPGRDYVLSFQLGMYPGSSVYSDPIRVRVKAGNATAEFRHDAPAPSAGGVWQSFALPFRANNATTLIRLQNLEANRLSGLDRVAIAEISAAASPSAFTLVSATVDGGGGTSASSDRRFSLSGTIGQPDAGLLETGGKHLFGGFWGPGHSLYIAREGEYVRVSWDFGLGFGELQTTAELENGPGSSGWTPVSLAGNTSSLLLPANEAMRFFRIREN